jgi:hypothetical protein
MASRTNEIVPRFNFSKALKYTPDRRIQLCVKRVRDRLMKAGLWDIFGVPPIPDAGVSEDELQRLESQLGVRLPNEYRLFLKSFRYLVMDDGRRIWGFDHERISIGGPWVSEEHRLGVRYLVFADCWNYADGDQLMFDLGDPEQVVVAYLHEHGPLYEEFAPSFSLALWRLAYEPL